MLFLTQHPEGDGAGKTNWKFIAIVAVFAVIVGVGILGYLRMIEEEFKIPPLDIPEKVIEDETADWLTYRNEEYGFEVKYPKEWYVEGNNIFNSKDPYERDWLKEGVMKAQFQHHSDESISSIQAYIEKLIEWEVGYYPGGPIEKDSIIYLQIGSGLNIVKFSGGAGNLGYVIPIKKDFSEVIYVIVWNPDPLFERVLSTFIFLGTTPEFPPVTDMIEITITTNKTEYEIFEEPRASIYNNSSKAINIFFQIEHLFRIERYIDGEWKKLDTHVSSVPASQINYDNKKSSLLQGLKMGIFTSAKFNFCLCSTVNLEEQATGPRIEKEGIFEPGKYRLVAPYSSERSDVIQYVYSNEFTIKDYKFNSPEFFCKYRYGDSETMRTVLFSSFFNFDQDSEKELLIVCGDPGHYSYLYVLDNQNGEYKKVLLYREMSGQRRQFSDLKVIDIDEDGIDEIFFKESGWYMSGGTNSWIIYSPKYNEWFYFQSDWEADIDSGEKKYWTDYSSNLESEEYKIFRDFLDQASLKE